MRRIALGYALLLGLCAPVFAAPPEPKVMPAVDGIFDAFKTHPLVGLGEWHGLAQMLDFYVVLLREPRFAAEVGNIVVEVGGAQQQAVIDRYVNGEQVPYAELRKVWSDAAGWIPTVTDSGSINIYSTIREVNAKLPPERRIKVWLGQPPLDWASIKTKADWDRIGNPVTEQRDSYTAQLIERELLAKNKKALVIYGTGHLLNEPSLGGEPSIRMLLDARYPGALFTATPYVGYFEKACAARFERRIKGWPIPSLVTPIRGSSLENEMWRKGCGPFPKPNDLPQDTFDEMNRKTLGLFSDALLYLGPRKSLVTGPRDLDIILDLEFRAEMNRRMMLRTGKPLGPPNTANNVPQPFFDD
jgi:hypothetical protein